MVTISELFFIVKLNTAKSYQEWWRDWPLEATATGERSHGANSCYLSYMPIVDYNLN
ncbi:hypothetical protein J45TS6_16170 [Paenibacillus sp. J45TS6]|nr:hypothetical protein J45TS6_16170 [Paenibacillus sp. J45TS6]